MFLRKIWINRSCAQLRAKKREEKAARQKAYDVSRKEMDRFAMWRVKQKYTTAEWLRNKLEKERCFNLSQSNRFNNS